MVHNFNLISSSVFFIFFKIVISWIVSKVKGYKMAQNDKKLSGTLHLSGTIHHMIFIFDTPVQNDGMAWHFFIFQNYDFPGS